MFPDNFTKEGVNGDILATKRAFLMGNALVVGIVKKIGEELKLIDEKSYSFCWITDYPMYEYDEKEKKIDFSHNLSLIHISEPTRPY